MDDTRAQFLLLVGNACRDASTGRISVELSTDAGDHVTGVPEAHADEVSDTEVDDTGWSDALSIAGTTISLASVVTIRIDSPTGPADRTVATLRQ